MKKIFATLVFLSFSIFLFSQEWVNKLMDPEVNFYEVQESFNNHWGEQGYERGKGWKQYKRWEYHTAPRSYPNGVRGHSKEYFEAWKEAQKINKSQPKSNTSAGGICCSINEKSFCICVCISFDCSLLK